MDEEKGYEPPSWLLTYGDMVTLLVTFFVMLISVSTINMDKSKKILMKVQESFESGGSTSLLDDNTQLTEDTPEAEIDPVVNMDSFAAENQIESFIAPEEVYDYILNFINENELSRFVDIEDIKTGCKLKIPAHLCFEKGESVLKRDAYPAFDKLGTVLQMVRGNIVIDADTGKATKDVDLPINRAATLCEYFMNKEEIEPSRIAILGNRTNINYDDTIEITLLKK